MCVCGMCVQMMLLGVCIVHECQQALLRLSEKQPHWRKGAQEWHFGCGVVRFAGCCAICRLLGGLPLGCWQAFLKLV